jgi:predicted PurR-regulated permease PerM
MAESNDNGKVIRVELSSYTAIKTVLVLIAFALLYYLRDLALVILLSIVIASAIEPVAHWLGRYRIPRVLAVLSVYVAAVLVFVVLVPFFVFPIVSDLSTLAVSLPARIGSLPFFDNPPAAITAVVGSFSFSDILNGFREGIASIPRGVAQTARLLFGGFFQLILVTVISFYLAVQPRGIESFLRLVVPIPHEKYAVDLWRRSQQKIGMWMQGQLLLGLIIGVLVFLGLTIFQVEHALLLAVLAAVFEIIPFFGPVLSAVPAVLLGFSVSPALGVMVLGFYIIIQQFENHLIYPLVVRKIVGVPPLMVIISLIVGAQLAGFVGMLLAVPVATVLMEMLGDFERSKFLVQKRDA